MKGQRLFVREVSASDHDAIESFYADERQEAPDVRGTGYLAKIAGRIAAHAIVEAAETEWRFVHLYVGAEMRRKRVATVFLLEIAGDSRGKGVERLVVGDACELAGFFAQRGFERNGLVLAKSLVKEGVR